ncbi:MAG TPA: hypothetical protein VGO91_01705, partial [Pyrinomonadaceae bacterium]|nr:hypothetical protein [Pyrinomonadaceae bacterium]
KGPPAVTESRSEQIIINVTITDNFRVFIFFLIASLKHVMTAAAHARVIGGSQRISIPHATSLERR